MRAITGKHGECAGRKCDSATKRRDNCVAWSKKQTCSSDDDDVERDVRRMNNVGGPIEPGYQNDIQRKLQSGLEGKCARNLMRQRVDHGETANNQQRRQCLRPSLVVTSGNPNSAHQPNKYRYRQAAKDKTP